MRYLISLALALSASPAFAENKAPDWRALAIADVEAAYTATLDNHPGMYDTTNPGFPKLLETARSEALKLAKKVTTAGGFTASLDRFKAVLGDGHAGAYANVPEELSLPIRWPGFVAAWRRDSMYVYKSAAGGPPAGAQILSCDNVPVRPLVERNVFAYRVGRKIPGEWWSSARRAFVDAGNPFVHVPQNCRFKIGRTTENRPLKWVPIPDYYQEWKNGSANGDLLPIGLSEKAPGLFWFALPDFEPDDAGVAAYQKLYTETEAAHAKLLSARAIVLDLRSNQGGSSRWSKNLARRIWGAEAVNSKVQDYFAKTRIVWRPTSGNLRKIRQIMGLSEDHVDTALDTSDRDFLQKFTTATATNEKYLAEPINPPSATQNAAKQIEPSLKTPVYVIVPGQCASACLDAIDYFKRFSNTKLIGAPSSSDSTYMEVRAEPLPSGMGGAIIPMKMYVNRPRGNGIYYTPDIVMADLDWSTANFQKRIETDLKR